MHKLFALLLLLGLAGAQHGGHSSIGPDLKTLSGKAFDRAFLSMMIPHHASAIEMALLAIQRSSDPRIIKLARDILVSQSEEIYQFRNWLK